MTLYGKQTELAKKHFKIGTEPWPREVIVAQALIKKAAARTNATLGHLDKKLARAIEEAADEVQGGKHSDEFPLTVWQSGSGTQFNMNVNEVVATRASQILKKAVHPNDHVNMSQSTNDTVPTAIHIATLTLIVHELSPSLAILETSLAKKAKQFSRHIKTGRTHLQDAVPITLGQEFSGYARQIEYAREHMKETSKALRELAIGGTALGTGLNAPKGYKQRVVRELAALTKLPLKPAKNVFAAMAAHDAIIATLGALKVTALALAKIANDIRFLASGPRAGLGEITLPANEPGSSIMPGKVNPTQSEMVMMVCAQVIGNDAGIVASALALSNFDMQASKPLLAHSLLQSIRLLSDGIKSFEEHCVRGIEADKKRLRAAAERSLMLVTVLNKHIGYDNAAKIVKKAHAEDLSLTEAGELLGFLTKVQFEKWVDIEKMV